MKSIACAVLFSANVLSAPALAAPDAPQQTPDTYAVAGERITIAPGRALNLRCSGEGPQTVLLEAGGNADSATWFQVQSLLAPQTRVCAYDRAGYGFSDEGPLPRDLDADVADLSALGATAGLRTPLVLVGHSLGSNIVRAYAQQHPQDVAGLVLVDPPEQGAEAQLPPDWKQQGEAGRVQRNAFLDTCLAAAEAGTLDRGEGPLGACLRAAPPWQSAPVAAATRAYKLEAAYWRTLRSELDANTAIFAVPVPETESYGDLPLVVVAAPAADMPGVPDEVANVLRAAREQTHARLVAASRNGRRVEVPDSSHDVQLDAPEAVAAAVATVLGGTESGSRPR
ncbi:alpha/beta hydrolase [Pseudoxanthomonas suwonensis]|uniref:alpha/beta hydrolase n=1 Tax=Pseudoxanthomonas suwonensis TaxID=314722 RepID=UPI00138F1615|nr:alpha/beta hydrolase [Pseudoxanthomonas suwonensis]KAF1701472.1 alpha/beta hydrolase [Pseudoxanthomonas suwonensis]